MDKYFHTYVKFENNERVSILEKGKIRISCKMGFRIIYLIFFMCLYHNLLHVGQLFEKSYDLHFKYGDGTISDEKLGLIVKVKINRSHLWLLSLNCGDLPYFNFMTCDDS